MDGTIYLEDKMIVGSVETLNYLIEKEKHLLFVTNKTTQTRDEYSKFLINNGIFISNPQILTAANNCLKFLKNERKSSKFYAIAEEVFINEIIEAGLTFTENPKDIEIVIVSLDRNYSTNKFEIAKNALLNGAEFLAANIDCTCPVINNEIIDGGTIISELEKTTNIKLQQHFGKPSNFMISALEEKLKYKHEDYILIGDRLETDILMGNKMGIDTVLVNSGVFNQIKNSTILATYNITSIIKIL